MTTFCGAGKALVEFCCSLAFRAHNQTAGLSSYLFAETISAVPTPCAVFAFAGSWSADDWIATDSASPFGESRVDLSLFPSLRRIEDDAPALVNAAFLRSLQRLLNETSLRTEVYKALIEKKRIVFTGHSSGGAISALATIWLMEQSIMSNNQNIVRPSCITFGAPLVGDDILCHAVQREGWQCLFSNIILMKDIVPRILLAPLSTFKEEFQAILHVICPRSLCFSLNVTRNSHLATTFYKTVLNNVLSVSSQQACLYMGCTNPLLGALSNFIKLSPYRPFGKYVFCTTSGQAVGVKNSDAVVQLLFSFFQHASEQDLMDAACCSLAEHLLYELKVNELSEAHVFIIDNLEAIPMNLDDGGFHKIKDLDLGTDARLSIFAALELENQKQRNQARIDANYEKIQEYVNFLNKYRSTCEIRGLGYYDVFKLQKEKDDFDANVKRLELAGLWDEIIEMLRRRELPDDFERREEWVRLGTQYRLLVEPLDIANYYRHSKNEDTGPYMTKGRPKRYRYTEKWLEHAQKVEKGSVSESCFWGIVEELCLESSKKKPFEEMKERVLELENKLVGWLNTGKLGKEVLLDGSTYMKWWKTLPEHHKLNSCIASAMVSEGMLGRV